jgi:hypothetical protein
MPTRSEQNGHRVDRKRGGGPTTVKQRDEPTAASNNGGKSGPRKPKKAMAKRAANSVKTSAPVESVAETKAHGPTPLQEMGLAILAAANTLKATTRILSEVLIIGFCVSASMTANAWPCIHAILNGDTDSSLISMANFQIVAVLLMALAPLAMVKAKNRFTFVGALVLGLVLLIINAGNAIETASHVREAASNGPLAAQLKAKNLTERIKRDREARTALGTVTPTSDSEVQAAQAAVEAAKLAQEQECKKLGDHCRARQTITQAALEQLSAVSAQRALSIKAERLEQQIDDAQHELDSIGPVPAHADNIAYRYSKLTGISEEWLTDNWPTLCGIGVELLGLLGPLVVMAAFSQREVKAKPAEALPDSAPKPDDQTFVSYLQEPDDVEPEAAHFELEAPELTAMAAFSKRRRKATPVEAQPKRAAKSADPVVASLSEAVEALPETAHFESERSVPAPALQTPALAAVQVERYCQELAKDSEASLTAKELFDGYVTFCDEQGWTPVSKTSFGKLIKSALQVESSRKSSRQGSSGSRARNGASSGDKKDPSQVLNWEEEEKKSAIQRPHDELIELSGE